MLNAYGHCCVYCGRKMQRLTQDHITPLSRGGNHTKSNIVPACRSCNSKKGTGEPLVPVQPMLL
jgi:5-methylcytosine-specific restriction endonuclease McrA